MCKKTEHIEYVPRARSSRHYCSWPVFSPPVMMKSFQRSQLPITSSFWIHGGTRQLRNMQSIVRIASARHRMSP